MNKYNIKLTEDEAITLFEYFSRFDETDSLKFEHPAEYIALQRLSVQIEKTTAAMFKPEYKQLLANARNNISKDFEGYIPVENVQISWMNNAIPSFLWPEFIQINGMVFLKNEYSESQNIPEEPIEAECFINHIHILDLFSHNASLPDEPFWDYNHPDFQKAWDVGNTLIELWQTKLKRDFPNERFKIYLTKFDNPIIRFHKMRIGQIDWIAESTNIQEINDGNIIILET